MKKFFGFVVTMFVALTIFASSCSKTGCPGQTDLKLKRVDVSSCKDRFEPEPEP